ncbi:MAG: reverse transcriptase domain-containing protein [Thermoleophilia bacterium]|nr:reverse transcriptase domain-containing protein [Thermoleophilia bacterium]
MPSGDNTAKQDKVRELQVKLYLAAKRSPNRRLHALWDRIHRRDALERAWRQVRENRGAAGVDRITIAQIEEDGIEAFLDELQEELREERYRPQPARRVFIPKPGRSERRPLGIPRIKDRVCQTAAKIVLEPTFEADFRGCSFGFRPKRSAHEALDQIKREVMRGRRWVIDADIRGFFDALDPKILEHRDLVAAVGYCGLVSGHDQDKSGLFEVFFGELPHAPMIAACPLTIACRLERTFDLSSEWLFIGEIAAAYADEECLTGGQPDPRKADPILLTMPDNRYWSLGEVVGVAWSIGEDYAKGT